jgi:Tol biopolymer transport system component
MVFLTYDASVKGHPENKDVMLRMMTLKDKKITVLAKLFGGQGTMNVPSWSPDGKQFAFVSYQLVPKEGAGKYVRPVTRVPCSVTCGRAAHRRLTVDS